MSITCTKPLFYINVKFFNFKLINIWNLISSNNYWTPLEKKNTINISASWFNQNNFNCSFPRTALCRVRRQKYLVIDSWIHESCNNESWELLIVQLFQFNHSRRNVWWWKCMHTLIHPGLLSNVAVWQSSS